MTASITQHDIDRLVQLYNQRRFEEAEPIAKALTSSHPQFGLGWKVLGIVLRRLGRGPEALLPIAHAARLLPGDAEVHNHHADISRELGQFAQAASSYRQSLAIAPNNAEVLCNLGSTLVHLEKLAEAIASFQRALEIKPQYPQALCNLGTALKDLGRLDEAQLCYRQALGMSPDLPEAHGNLGVTLYGLGLLQESIACYRRALQLRPEYAEAYCNLGNSLKDLGHLDEALACFGQALRINPAYAGAYNNLGVTLSDLGHLDEAEASYRKAVQAKPDNADAYSNLLFTLNYHPDKSDTEIYASYRQFEAQFGMPQRAKWRAHGNPGPVGRRLKVGYVSPDFRQHSCQYFLEPLLAGHDKRVVEVYAYAELTREDTATARFKTYVDHWIPTKGVSDDALAERIRADGIDILVDLAGHTRGNRLLVFARKPAPVSLSWLGFGYTTGLSAVDHFLTDQHTVPPAAEALFSEAPWRLDRPALVYRPALGMGEVGPLPALERRYVTFGTLSRSLRINHRTVRAWSEILRQLPQARLVVDSGDFRSVPMQQRLVQQFVQHGIEAQRLSVDHHSPPWDTLRGIDITLDCFPHNSGTTLFESLYMGVPFVTLAGRPGVGRLGNAILQGAGLPQWVADSEAAYVALAVQRATDLGALGALRADLRTRMANSALMDEAAFARSVEAAYRSMWQRYLSRAVTP